VRLCAELTLVLVEQQPLHDGVLEAGVDPHVGVQTGRIAWEIEDFDLIATHTAIGSRIISASSIQRNSSLSLERVCVKCGSSGVVVVYSMKFAPGRVSKIVRSISRWNEL